jgi:hypothetical protein
LAWARALTDDELFEAARLLQIVGGASSET